MSFNKKNLRNYLIIIFLYFSFIYEIWLRWIIIYYTIYRYFKYTYILLYNVQIGFFFYLSLWPSIDENPRYSPRSLEPVHNYVLMRRSKNISKHWFIPGIISTHILSLCDFKFAVYYICFWSKRNNNRIRWKLLKTNNVRIQDIGGNINRG